MTAKYVQTALLGSLLIGLGVGGVSVSTQAQVADSQVTSGAPTELVQAFLDSKDYQYLSDEDKAVWDEQTWNQVQQSALEANQPRLPQSHEFYELESFVREFVTVEAVDYERLDDDNVEVTVRTAYPNLLILVDDYAETRSSAAYDQLASYQAQFESGELTADDIEVYESEMPWQVKDSGVYVNAAQMQENMDNGQAQGRW